MGKLAFNRLLNIQKCLFEIADADYCGANTLHLRMRSKRIQFSLRICALRSKKSICDSQPWWLLWSIWVLFPLKLYTDVIPQWHTHSIQFVVTSPCPAPNCIHIGTWNQQPTSPAQSHNPLWLLISGPPRQQDHSKPQSQALLSK